MAIWQEISILQMHSGEKPLDVKHVVKAFCIERG